MLLTAVFKVSTTNCVLIIWSAVSTFGYWTKWCVFSNMSICMYGVITSKFLENTAKKTPEKRFKLTTKKRVKVTTRERSKLTPWKRVKLTT